jgi:hypothetical protein
MGRSAGEGGWKPIGAPLSMSVMDIARAMRFRGVLEVIEVLVNILR